MGTARTARRGRPATASREAVIAAVREQYFAGQRVDVTIVARNLGLGRATIYRWFGSRERLLGEVLASELEALFVSARRRVRRRGAAGLLEIFDHVNRALARSPALRRFVEQEQAAAMRLLTASDGPVQPRSVACVADLIESEVAAGRYDPPADPQTLAYAVVRLAEAFLYNDAAYGIRGEHARLLDVEAALLGVPRARCASPHTRPPAAARPRARGARTPPPPGAGSG